MLPSQQTTLTYAATMPTQLPLFPLGTVLVPGELLPLRVFEPRYRALLADLMRQRDEGGRPAFGVIAIRQGLEVGRERLRALYGVGCVAEILEVQPEPDGSSDLLAVGRQRFRLLDLDAEAGTPYLTGLVEWCEEPVTAVQPELVQRVQDAFDAYCHQLGLFVAGSEATDGEPGGQITGGASEVLGGTAREDPTMLSYLVTGSMALHLPERQALLAAPDAGSRLRGALRLLRRELTLFDVAQVVPDPR